MKIYHPENLFKTLQNKHLLLDTNVFIDSFNLGSPKEYTNFFNNLKDNNTTLTTITGVVYEFLKGSKNIEAVKKKEDYIKDIIDLQLPNRELDDEIIELINRYGPDGGAIQMVDYHLGANLVKYKSSLFLITRDVSDFPQYIFLLASTVSFSTGKGIFTYGIYTYDKKHEEKEENDDEVPF